MRRAVLALLIVPPLIALGLLAWATLSHRPRPVRTGDALLDAYLQALVDSGVASGSESFSPLENSAALPGAVWRDWEQRFGADPRFWMLCYYMRPSGTQREAGDTTYNGWDIEYLRTARERGSTDWIALLNLLHLEYSGWREAARAGLGLRVPDRSATPAERQRFAARLWAEVQRVHGPQFEQLQAELRAAGAGQAQAHYYLAQLAADGGDIPGALGEINAGNAAPNNDVYIGFPFDALLTTSGQGQALAGDTMYSAVLHIASIPVSIPNSSGFKHMVRELAAWAAQRGDLAALQALHRCCCRCGSSAGADRMQATLAAGADGNVLKAIQDLTPATDTTRLRALSAAQVQRGQIRSALYAIGPSAQSLPAIPSGLSMVLEGAPATLCGGRYLSMEMQRSFARDLITQQAALSGPIRRQFEALERMDLAP
jgi:hypothetical protein